LKSLFDHTIRLNGENLLIKYALEDNEVHTFESSYKITDKRRVVGKI